MNAQTHESYESFKDAESSSDRSFGLVFSAVFLLAFAVPLIKGRPEPRYWSLAVAALFFVIALLAPRVLGPLNRVWLKLGRVLQFVTTPVLMGVIFFGVVTPLAVLSRAFGKDPLRRKIDSKAATYWIARPLETDGAQGMRNQF